MSERKEEI